MSGTNLNPPLMLTVCDDDGCHTELEFSTEKKEDSGGFHGMLKSVGRRLSHPFGGASSRSRSRSRRFLKFFEKLICTSITSLVYKCHT